MCEESGGVLDFKVVHVWAHWYGQRKKGMFLWLQIWVFGKDLNLSARQRASVRLGMRTWSVVRHRVRAGVAEVAAEVVVASKCRRIWLLLERELWKAGARELQREQRALSRGPLAKQARVLEKGCRRKVA